MRRLCLAVALSCALSAGLLALGPIGAARAQPVGTVVEFATPTAGAGPMMAVAGPDGNLWVTESVASKIARVTPSGDVTEFPTPGGPVVPTSITAGRDGNLYFSQDTGTLGRISTAGEFSSLPLPDLNDKVAFITSGPDGNLWYTAFPNHDIVRMTPTGTATIFAIPSGHGGSVINPGDDGALWFSQNGAELIGRITTDGTITEFALPSPVVANFPARGHDANMWFTSATTNQVGRITPSGVVTMFDIPTANSQPMGMATGPDHNLWFAEMNANQVARITTDGVITEFSLPTANSGPVFATTGPDGRLWYTEYAASAVARVSTGETWELDISTATAIQSTPVNTVFPEQLRVRTLDPDGDVVAGTPVTFAVPTSGVSGSFPGGATSVTVTSDASGIAVAPPLMANENIGSFTATVTAPAASTDATFQLTNTPPPPATAPAPTTTAPTAVPTATTTPPIATATLPATGPGGDLRHLTIVGILLTAVGAGVTLTSRRRLTP